MRTGQTAQWGLRNVHRAFAEDGWQAGQVGPQQPVKAQQSFGKRRVVTGSAEQVAASVDQFISLEWR